ncbi:MAG: Xaa-Pro peptidase family protein [Defluviitaleaceae bacterium]|nr:Xaa-Pro peptidase family protein [Defluviitaleaceae bacterium]
MHTIATEKIKQAAGYLGEIADLWIIYSSEGSDSAVSLLTGLKTVGKTFFLLTKDANYAICSIIDAQESEDSGLFDQVIRYRGDPDEALRELVAKIGPKKIALNYSQSDNLCDGLTTGRFRYLKEVLGPEYAAGFVSSEPILSKVRAVKSPAELALIRRAVEITQEIYDEVFAALRPGLTEYQVGEMFVDAMSRRGVTNATTKALTMPIVMKERIAHRSPGQAIIQPGDFLIMDFGVDYMGYCSDISRTVYFLKEGETQAPERFRNMFDAAYNAISKAFEAAKPGVQGYMVDEAARSYLLSRGMPEITHATGHQIGQRIHDGGALFAPRWERYGNAPYGVIHPGMVFTLEPTILNDDGDFSVLCEENILVTESGAEFLSRRQEKLILVGPA